MFKLVGSDNDLDNRIRFLDNAVSNNSYLSNQTYPNFTAIVLAPDLGNTPIYHYSNDNSIAN